MFVYKLFVIKLEIVLIFSKRTGRIEHFVFLKWLKYYKFSTKCLQIDMIAMNVIVNFLPFRQYNK